jgi:superfamily II DNA helicase RecQ
MARKTFGVEHLRPEQESAMIAVLERRDALVALPTGFGKSLIYQVPAMLLDRPTIVVSPLIALMADQERVRCLAVIAQYAQTEGCRSVFLRRFFGEEDPPSCGTCDRCRVRAATTTHVSAVREVPRGDWRRIHARPASSARASSLFTARRNAR